MSQRSTPRQDLIPGAFPVHLTVDAASMRPEYYAIHDWLRLHVGLNRQGHGRADKFAPLDSVKLCFLTFEDAKAFVDEFPDVRLAENPRVLGRI